jgi:hypothetical protein
MKRNLEKLSGRMFPLAAVLAALLIGGLLILSIDY